MRADPLRPPVRIADPWACVVAFAPSGRSGLDKRHASAEIRNVGPQPGQRVVAFGVVVLPLVRRVRDRYQVAAGAARFVGKRRLRLREEPARRDREDSTPRFPLPSIGPLAHRPSRPLIFSLDI